VGSCPKNRLDNSHLSVIDLHYHIKKFELFSKLTDLKLVSVIPRFGTRVNPIDINEIRAAFEVKITLERLSEYMAAERVMQD